MSMWTVEVLDGDRLNALFEAFGLKQHVTGPTHIDGTHLILLCHVLLTTMFRRAGYEIFYQITTSSTSV